MADSEAAELRAWVESVWDLHLARCGLGHTSKTDRRSTIEQLAQVIEARSAQIAVAREAALRAALAPFAAFRASFQQEECPDDFEFYVTVGEHGTTAITMGDLRRARAALLAAPQGAT